MLSSFEMGIVYPEKLCNENFWMIGSKPTIGIQSYAYWWGNFESLEVPCINILICSQAGYLKRGNKNVKYTEG